MVQERIVLLFCHGGSFHKQSWDPILRRLRASALLQRVACEFVAIDWRYHGAKRSDADAATLYYEDGDKSSPRVEHPGKHWPEWAPQDLLRMTKLLRNEDAANGRVTRIVGVGHSMGAATLLKVEVTHPGTFAGLVLFEPPFTVGTESVAAEWTASSMVVNTLIREEEWNTWDEVLEHFKTGKAYRRWHPESLKSFLEGGVTKTKDGKKYRLVMPPIQEASLYCHAVMAYTIEQLARVQYPIVFEFGDHTQLFSLMDAHNVVEALPSKFSLAEPLKGKTHLTVLEDPDTCASHIVADLENLPVVQRALAKATSSKL